MIKLFSKMFWKFSGDAFWVLTRFCSSKTDRVTNFWLSSAVNSCYSCHNHRNLMLEALYDKTCLPNCVGNSLEMHFEYLNISVAQKLTELRIFGCHLWKSYFLETWFFCTTDFGQLIFLPTHLFGQLIFDNSLFCLTHFFDQLNFWQLIFCQLIFLTTNCFDSLSNYLTNQLGVWDSRPLVLFLGKKG